MRLFRMISLFLSLLVFWQVLSARVDPLFMTFGVVTAALTTWFGAVLFESTIGRRTDVSRLSLFHLVWFCLWLVTRLVPAGLAVARVVVDPRVAPRPGVVRFRTGLPSPAARTMLANAITLVPGTITVDVDGDEFTVHAFTPESMADLASADTQRRIARAFRVPPDEPPELRWEPLHDDIEQESA